MKRRDFIAALSAAARPDEITATANTLEIKLDRVGGGTLEVRRDFGLLEEDEYADSDGYKRDREASFRLIRKLLTDFERMPALRGTVPTGEDAAPQNLSDAEIIDRATNLTITIYRDEGLFGHVSINVDLLPDELNLDADALLIIRELLTRFERKRAVYQTNAANKIFHV